MALTADKVRYEHGLKICEKIIPWGVKWTKNSGSFKSGNNYKADRKLSGGSGKVKGVTIHNTADLPGVKDDAEQYTRATWPNQNMNDVRVHYYVDECGAWQNLREDEIGWHAADGNGPGNETTLAIEIIMDGTGSAEDTGAENNGALLAAILLVRHNLTINDMHMHNFWMYKKDSMVPGARKNCPIYIIPHWDTFKSKVQTYMNQIKSGQEVKPIIPPQNDPNTSTGVKKGDKVQFKGGPIYTSAAAAIASSSKGASVCKVTGTFNGVHPYHCVSEDNGGVYGWVDAENVTLIGVAALSIGVGARVQYSGPLYVDSYGGQRGRTVNGTYTVERVINDRKCGVLLAGLGWVPESACKVIEIE